jgi:lipopolysaccharide export system protein LptA
MKRAALIVALVLATGLAAPAAAVVGLGGSKSSDAPVSIEAEDGIEWQQAKQTYTARGNAKATQGDSSVKADALTAHYRTAKNGDTEIWRIDADGNVRITSTTRWATGEKGVYDVDKGVLVLMGKTVRLESPTEKIRANQSLEYFEQRRIAVARGGAVAVKDGRELRADVLTAHMRENKQGQLEMARVEAFGNVEVATASEVARAQYGDYNPDSGIANLAGGVKITRGQNQLNGEFAEVNMKTGISRLLSQPKPGTGAGGRVRGVFQPKTAPAPASPGPAPVAPNPAPAAQ